MLSTFSRGCGGKGRNKGMALMLAIDNAGLSLHCVPDISYHPPGHPSGFLGLTLPFKAIDSSRGAFEKETEPGSTKSIWCDGLGGLRQF